VKQFCGLTALRGKLTLHGLIHNAGGMAGGRLS
jgi:hypothetical protein